MQLAIETMISQKGWVFLRIPQFPHLLVKMSLEQCINQRPQARTGGEDQQQTEDEQQRHHRDLPTELALPEEAQQFTGDAQIGPHSSKESFYDIDLIFSPRSHPCRGYPVRSC